MRPPRIRGFDDLGCHRYALTCCTRNRQPFCTDPACLDLTRRELQLAATREAFDVVLYCFMPEHVHVLVNGQRDNSDFRAFVASFKQHSAHAHVRRTGDGRLWQSGYWDRVLRPDDTTVDVVRYIAGNPVRAGLVRSPLAYSGPGSDVLDLSTLLVDTAIDHGRRG